MPLPPPVTNAVVQAWRTVVCSGCRFCRRATQPSLDQRAYVGSGGEM